MKKYEFYYQIDYIDSDGLANYIDTLHDEEKAIEHVNILNNANRCLNDDTKFVLDMYGYIPNVEESDVIIRENITKEFSKGEEKSI